MTAIPLQLSALFPLGHGGSLRQPGASSPRMIPKRAQAHGLASRDARSPSRDRRVNDRSDESLLLDYLDGDRAAFRELTNRYRDELLHFLIRFLGSRAAADDVFQETFLQVHLSADTFDASRRFKPWLFTIAANKARDYHRKHIKKAPASLSANVGDESEGRRYIDLLEADIPGPDAPVLDAERSRLVRTVIDSMSPHMREILLLSYFQKLSYNQIADVLEIPLGTVKSRLHTAVAAFAKAWTNAMSASRNKDE
jgi:RNA polymerase sigma-70 factor (ECF subfamily)